LRKTLGLALGLGLMSGSLGDSASAALGGGGAGEVISYHWRLRGIGGFVAGLFLPSRGEGQLTTRPLPGGKVLSELMITSRDATKGEYWNYGAEFDPRTGATSQAWSSYSFRGKRHSKKQEVTEPNVMDITSAIYRIRRDRLTVAQRMRIWSDGKIYWVLVSPHDEERRGGPPGGLRARHYVIQGLQIPGQSSWNGHVQLWLDDDEAATPVAILIDRGWSGVRLEQTTPAQPGAQSVAKP
jgi:hypothetical protein